MTPADFQSLIATGEDSRLQFRVDIHNADSLAAEMAAMAIRRALDDWPAIGFVDDREGNQFVTVVYRNLDQSSVEKTGSAHRDSVSTEAEGIYTEGDMVSTEGASVETEAAVVELLRADPSLTAKTLAQRLDRSTRAIEMQLAKLRDHGRLRRIGPRKGGHWQVIDDPESDSPA